MNINSHYGERLFRYSLVSAIKSERRSLRLIFPLVIFSIRMQAFIPGLASPEDQFRMVPYSYPMRLANLIKVIRSCLQYSRIDMTINYQMSQKMSSFF